MIDHTGITVSDIQRSKNFYTAVLASLDYVIQVESEEAVGYGVVSGYGKSSDPGGDFWISMGVPHTPRTHIAFSAVSRGIVDNFYRVALLSGGTGNGEAGVRSHYHKYYYAAYVLDPDGYNIEAVVHPYLYN
jgi:catechol 2,3-dioxygenase-like lactoylglutathione lyase family enzyme